MPVKKPFLQTLSGEVLSVPPVWLMRQAGRYLPEYRETRAQAGDFKTLVYTPHYATEVTLQPLRRFNFDAAILFSDILTIPEALGRTVSFGKDHGPVLEPLKNIADLKENPDHLNPVYEAVSSIRAALVSEGFTSTTLIGFAGAPWTVACYIVEGQGSKEFLSARTMAYGRPSEFQELIDRITEITCLYLSRQIEAGAEVIQIFDSWAGVLPESEFRKWVIAPTQKIVSFLKAKYPDIPVIGFPRQAGLMIPDYVRETGVDAVSLDTQVQPRWAATTVQSLCPVQGNLDPAVLITGGAALDRAIDTIKSAFSGRPYIFNLGHGIDKSTPPDHVGQLISRIRHV